RAWASVHRRLPVFRDGLFGRGMIAMSEAGRARFGEFPLMVADDLFIDSLFTADEKAEADEVRVVVEAPGTTAELLRRLARVRRGSSAMRDAGREGTLPIAVRAADRWSWLRDVVAKDLRLLPAGAVYASITTTAALRARTQSRSSMDWGRGQVGRGEERRPRIGFLGVQADTANLGLAALAYSVIALLDETVEEPADFVLFSVNSDAALERMRSELGITQSRIKAVPFRHKSPIKMAQAVREIHACDVVVDFTGGDSFSDIYGLTRLLRKLFHKQLVLATGRPLVLAPQTYGPLQGSAGKPWYRHVVRKAAAVFTRDHLSLPFLEELTSREIHLSTDVAVRLPHTPRDPAGDGRVHVGVNVSGLLWAGGYTGDNQFSLETDYRQYCRALVSALLARGRTVHLVAHVVVRPGESAHEDDFTAAQELLEEFPDCHLAPPFTSPIEAKSWISGLDAFAGSRMHASIAAFTAGVPTVPVAYSRKFAGLFGNLGYDVGVDLTTTPTDRAVAETLAHLDDPEALREQSRPALATARERIAVFTDRFTVLPTSSGRW
ncbi:MAG: polysaccharide pyruvyl transferase family protein, partial [Propionibacterium sp.]|nr:polysaccharide pyruvyl transferase family protein [Propionibacterium sp.]